MAVLIDRSFLINALVAIVAEIFVLITLIGKTSLFSKNCEWVDAPIISSPRSSPLSCPLPNFLPTYRMTISKYLARDLRVRRSGVLPLCLGPNSVAERINPPSEIFGRQPVCPTRISRLIYVVTSVTHSSPTSFFRLHSTQPL